MSRVFLYELSFSRIVDVLDGENIYSSFTIGYFSSKKRAVEMIERYRNRIEGFNSYSGAFEINKRRLSGASHLTNETAYILWYSEYNEQNDYDEEYIFGIYDSYVRARKSQAKYMRKKAYQCPEDFNLEEIEINQLAWQFGFSPIS